MALNTKYGKVDNNTYYVELYQKDVKSGMAYVEYMLTLLFFLL